MSPIQWDDRPPSGRGQRLSVPVWSPPPQLTSFVRLLGAWRGVRLHWLQQRTLPCRGSDCPYCAAAYPLRWMGYAPALLWRGREEGWQAIVCPITDTMATQLCEKKLGGLVIEVARPGRRRNGEIVCKVVERVVKDALPPPFDVVPILLRMWQLQQRHAGPVDPADGPPPTLLPFVPPSELPPAAEGGV